MLLTNAVMCAIGWERPVLKEGRPKKFIAAATEVVSSRVGLLNTPWRAYPTLDFPLREKGR